MRKNLSIVLGSMLVLSLTACGGKTASNAPETTAATPAAETLTGSAEGFGGEVTVTLTKSGDTITDCKVVGDAETDGIGKAALDALGEITGETMNEAIIDEVFSRFCVGK